MAHSGLVADVEAALAEDDLVADGDQGRGQRPRLRVGSTQQVVGQALGGLGTDPRQTREGLDQARDGLDEGRGHASITSPGCEAAGHGRHLLLGQLARRAQRVVDRRDDEVLEHLDVVGVDRRRVDGDAHQLLLPGHGRAHDATAGRAVHGGGLEFALDAQHLLLHLLGHPLQVGHPHRLSSSCAFVPV